VRTLPASECSGLPPSCSAQLLLLCLPDGPGLAALEGCCRPVGPALAVGWAVEGLGVCRLSSSQLVHYQVQGCWGQGQEVGLLGSGFLSCAISVSLSRRQPCCSCIVGLLSTLVARWACLSCLVGLLKAWSAQACQKPSAYYEGARVLGSESRTPPPPCTTSPSFTADRAAVAAL
jgi:hypothetical protein